MGRREVREDRGHRMTDRPDRQGLPGRVTAPHPAPAAIIRRLVEHACNGGNLAALDEALAPVGADSARGVSGVGNLREALAAFQAYVPDARWTIVEQVAEGDTVVTRLRVRGAFSGPLLGLAPPGRPATLEGMVIARFVGACVADVWLQADLLGLLQQLDVLPSLDLSRALTLARVARTGAIMATPLAHDPAARDTPWTPPDGRCHDDAMPGRMPNGG
jgi:predicted ester cyclase